MTRADAPARATPALEAANAAGVKQSPGWNLTQPQPGWHQWTTPRGRTYTQGPKHYPV